MTPGRSESTTAIIRAAGERTETLCCHLLSAHVPQDRITVLHERPLAAAVARSFEVGLDSGRKWTLCIDADVLVCNLGIARLLELGSGTDESVFVVQGNVLDKLFGIPRAAGNHLYRTAHLAKALACIPASGESLRPETFTIKRMALHGFPSEQTTVAVGLHDYEQYYRDIFRKAFVHARKHGRYLPYMVHLWRRLATSDPDYQVALWGLRAGLLHEGPVQLDVAQPAFADAHRVLDDHGWQDKDPLAPRAISAEDIARAVAEHRLPPELGIYTSLRDVPRGGLAAVGPLLSYIRAALRVVGWPASVRWLARSGGRGLRRALKRGSAGRGGRL